MPPRHIATPAATVGEERKVAARGPGRSQARDVSDADHSLGVVDSDRPKQRTRTSANHIPQSPTRKPPTTPHGPATDSYRASNRLFPTRARTRANDSLPCYGLFAKCSPTAKDDNLSLCPYGPMSRNRAETPDRGVRTRSWVHTRRRTRRLRETRATSRRLAGSLHRMVGRCDRSGIQLRPGRCGSTSCPGSADIIRCDGVALSSCFALPRRHHADHRSGQRLCDDHQRVVCQMAGRAARTVPANAARTCPGCPVAEVRDLDDGEAVTSQELRQGDFVWYQHV